MVGLPALAAMQVEVGYGSGNMIEDPEGAQPGRSELIFVAAEGDWRFKDEWSLGFAVVGAAPDLNLSSGLARWKLKAAYNWDNVQFFVGPTWTRYTSQEDGEPTSLEGIEIGGSARVDLTSNLHLSGLFAFSPILDGFSVSFPGTNVDTRFTGNISEYYFGLQYDLTPSLSLKAGLGGWRALEPVDQQRLVTVDYRRLGLVYVY